MGSHYHGYDNVTSGNELHSTAGEVCLPKRRDAKHTVVNQGLVAQKLIEIN